MSWGEGATEEQTRRECIYGLGLYRRSKTVFFFFCERKINAEMSLMWLELGTKV